MPVHLPRAQVSFCNSRKNSSARVMFADIYGEILSKILTRTVFLCKHVRVLYQYLSLEHQLLNECKPLLYPPEASGGYFGLASATLPPPRVERFSALTL